MSESNEKWVRQFTTDGIAKHKNGFTIYRITSYIFPRACPEAVTAVTVWKRYRELQTLQRKMRLLHQRLLLPGSCPAYTKWGYFRRFDARVLEDRRRCTQLLLDFIAKHTPLFTSADFVNFFQSSYPDPHADSPDVAGSNIEAIRSSLLLPSEALEPLEYQSSEEDSFSTQESISAMDPIPIEVNRTNMSQNTKDLLLTNDVEATGRVENVASVIIAHETNTDNLTLLDLATTSNTADILQPEQTKISQSKRANLNLPDLVSFQSLENQLVNSVESSTDSLSFLDDISEYLHDTKRPVELPDEEVLNNNESGKFNGVTNGSLISKSETDLTISSSQSVASFFTENKNKKTPTKANERKISGNSLMRKKMDEIDGMSQSHAPSTRSSSRLDISSMDSVFGSSSDLQENYVFEAGYLLSLGARNEAKGEYRKAFDCYKAAIEKMLIGVQGDTNEFRRQFVKDKTTKYLSYAEKIYLNHLNNPDDEMSSEDLPACVVPRRKLPSSSSVMPRPCDVSDLSRPYSELSQYRVLGVIGGQVMLVLCSQSQQCYAMKVIQKTCNQVPDEEFFTKSSQDNRLPVLPVDVPYMVKLAALIETPNLVFLVLQYVSGGKLFDYIDNYSRSVPETPQREVNLDNVFIDPEKIKKKNNLMDEPVLNDVESVKYSKNAGESKQIKFCESNDDAVNLEMSVTDIVINSQRLLLNVDDALSGRFLDDKKVSDVGDGDEAGEDRSRDKLTVMVKEVEDVFDGLQQKLEMILDEDEALKFDISTTRSALPPKTLCKWAAELLTAIDHLHQCGVICRNLSPENLLLGDHGHLMLTFMVGRCHQEAVTSLLASTELYVAPELLQPLLLTDRETYYDERAADFWSYGALLYELITGIKLSVVHPTGFNSHTILNFPRNLSHDAEALLSQLLCFDPSERLGSGDGGVEDIKSHAYFKHIDWHIIEEDYIFDSK